MGRKDDTPRRRTGFALMDPARHRKISLLASERSRKLVNGHRWDSAEAAVARMSRDDGQRSTNKGHRWTREEALQAERRRWPEGRRPAPAREPPPMRACDAALLLLRESGVRSICRDDSDLLQAIAVRGRLRCQGGGRRTVIAVLRALMRNPGRLVAQRVRGPSGRQTLSWYRPECVPRVEVSRDRPAGTGGTPSRPPHPSP